MKTSTPGLGPLLIVAAAGLATWFLVSVGRARVHRTRPLEETRWEGEGGSVPDVASERDLPGSQPPASSPYYT